MKIPRVIALSTLFTTIVCQGFPTANQQAEKSEGSVVRADAALDKLVPPAARIEKIGNGFDFTEGPVYMPEGYLLFSDIPRNTIYKWMPDGKVAEFRKPSGFNGKDAPPGAFIGSNGLTLDREGRLIICQHGNGRIIRLEKNGAETVLADKYEGKRLNSPNDAVYKSDGSLYFTDPPYGFPKEDDDPKKELKFNGIYRVAGGKLQLLVKDMSRPNGLAFSPDEKYLYVANSDPRRKLWMRYEVKADGTLGAGTVFYDVTRETADGLPDGLKVDKQGNLYCTGPGGVWIFSSQGKYLGRIQPPEIPANCAWGKQTQGGSSAALSPREEAKTLYLTARKGVYRIQLAVAGIRP
jgi:gluconolactonase